VTALNEESAVQESVVPEFAHAVRGYDRYQVDDYIERLNEWATGAQARAVEAEGMAQVQADEIGLLRERLAEFEDERPTTTDHAIKVATERAAATVTVAVQQADEIRRRAAADAEHRLEEASRQAIAIVEAARQSVSGLSEEAATERRNARIRNQTLVDEAAAEAELVGRRAAEEAAALIDGARTEAARLLAEADQQAADKRGSAEHDHRQATEGLAQLQRERTEIMGELTRLRGAIQTLIAGPDDDTAEV
jgi:cell division septum initiation protein DivIVA